MQVVTVVRVASSEFHVPLKQILQGTIEINILSEVDYTTNKFNHVCFKCQYILIFSYS